MVGQACLELKRLKSHVRRHQIVKVVFQWPFKVDLARAHLFAPNRQSFQSKLRFELASVDEFGKFALLPLEQRFHMLFEELASVLSDF